jgi:RNase H-fold protein (predicted Holliday junction resolvase)
MQTLILALPQQESYLSLKDCQFSSIDALAAIAILQVYFQQFYDLN